MYVQVCRFTHLLLYRVEYGDHARQCLLVLRHELADVLDVVTCPVVVSRAALHVLQSYVEQLQAALDGVQLWYREQLHLRTAAERS